MTRDDLDLYRSIEQTFFQRVTDRMSAEIYLYCLTGSLSRDAIITNWSDIDILLVLRSYTSTVFDTLHNTVKETEHPTKIGLTIFTLEEFNCELLKSSRTYLAINAICDGVLVPRICAPEIVLQRVPSELIRRSNQAEFAHVLHVLKRELLQTMKCDERKVYKYITILLKIHLQEQGIVANSYEVMLNNISCLRGFGPTFPSPQEILDNPGDKKNRLDTYFEFLNQVRKHSRSIFES